MALQGITSTRTLGQEEIDSIELSIKVAKMKKEKINRSLNRILRCCCNHRHQLVWWN